MEPNHNSKRYDCTFDCLHMQVPIKRLNLEIAPMAHLEQKGFKGQLENNEKWVYFQTKGVRFYQYAKHLFFKSDHDHKNSSTGPRKA